MPVLVIDRDEIFMTIDWNWIRWDVEDGELSIVCVVELGWG